MPKTCERSEVADIADYLRQRPNVEVPRMVVGRSLGIATHKFTSLLTSVAENYPQIGESDTNALIWVED
jgi:hypothetical protein